MFYQVYLVIAGIKLTILVLIVTDYIYIVILPHMIPATTTQSTKGKPCYDSPEYQGQTLLRQPRVPRTNHISKHLTSFITKVISINTLHHRLKTKSQTEVLIGTDCMSRCRGRRGCYRMVVGFTTTCVISVYHH